MHLPHLRQRISFTPCKEPPPFFLLGHRVPFPPRLVRLPCPSFSQRLPASVCAMSRSSSESASIRNFPTSESPFLSREWKEGLLPRPERPVNPFPPLDDHSQRPERPVNSFPPLKDQSYTPQRLVDGFSPLNDQFDQWSANSIPTLGPFQRLQPPVNPSVDDHLQLPLRVLSVSFFPDNQNAVWMPDAVGDYVSADLTAGWNPNCRFQFLVSPDLAMASSLSTTALSSNKRHGGTFFLFRFLSSHYTLLALMLFGQRPQRADVL